MTFFLKHPLFFENEVVTKSMCALQDSLLSTVTPRQVVIFAIFLTQSFFFTKQEKVLLLLQFLRNLRPSRSPSLPFRLLSLEFF